MLKKMKKVYDNSIRIGFYVKKKYDFDSVEEFEKYIENLQEKARKYDKLIQQQDKLC